MLRTLLLALASVVSAETKTYVVLWFDTEDHIDPIADDAALRIATNLSSLGVRATFKVVGEKARVLERRGRTDVIQALGKHCIGYHSDRHSIRPVPSLSLQHLGLLDGADNFERRQCMSMDQRVVESLPISDETIPDFMFQASLHDAKSFIETNKRLPCEVFVGSRTLSLADFAATLASHLISLGPIRLERGKVEFERYFATGAKASFRWPIRPEGFAPEELLALAPLQGWTLKPAPLR